MEVIHPRCAGLDVHKDTVVACVRLAEKRSVKEDVRTFATTTRGLLELAEWLQQVECAVAAMEATGVYWKPVWHVLEGTCQLVLANAADIKNMPGRKTDVNDATWIAQLLAHGLIRPSFVPPTPIQELRDLTRTRTQLVREISQHNLRIQKTLEDANVKLSRVVTDVLGATGRTIIEALIAGQTDPEALAGLRRGRLKATRDEMVDALNGRVREHHRFLLRLHLKQIDALKEGVRALEQRIQELIEPFRALVLLLMTIPGVSRTAAYVILAEIGYDMGRFPTAGHLLSWVGLCPRNDESAGKRRSTRIRHGNVWLKTLLVQVAWAAARSKKAGLRAQYHRLRGRRGPKKAVIAVAASILTSIYYMLSRAEPYRDSGVAHLTGRDHERAVHSLTRRLRALGYSVELKPAA